MSHVKLKPLFFSDPDIVAGDGIYSRYLDRYLSAGRYKFTISVDDNDNSAFYVYTDSGKNSVKYIQKSNGMDRQNATETTRSYADLFYSVESRRKCCGSTVLPSIDMEKSVKTGIFRRTVPGPVVHMKQTVKQSDDRSPPARIGDLRIRNLPGERAAPDRLLAEWTAPGGDFNAGSVASYRFVFSTRIEELLDPNGQPEVLLGFDRMERGGTAAKFDFNFPHYDRDFYVGAYGFDVAGNRGKISNLVHVRIPAPSYNGKGVSEGPAPIKAPTGEASDANWILIGGVSGAIGVLFLLAIVAIVYYNVVARKKSVKTGSTSSVMNGGGSATDETDSSSFDSDIKNIMANPLGPALRHAPTHHSHINSNGYSNGQPPVGVHHASHNGGHAHLNGGGNISLQATPTDTNSTNVTPVYWSASQLLSKLDHNKHHQHHASPYNNGGVAGNGSYGGYVPAGPHSLQPMLSPASLLGQQVNPSPANGGPASLVHNMSYEHRYQQWPYSNGSSSVVRQNIPEEYTITVEDSNMDNNSVATTRSPTNNNAKTSTASSQKVAPPVMPKPRNITQV